MFSVNRFVDVNDSDSLRELLLAHLPRQSSKQETCNLSDEPPEENDDVQPTVQEQTDAEQELDALSLMNLMGIALIDVRVSLALRFKIVSLFVKCRYIFSASSSPRI